MVALCRECHAVHHVNCFTRDCGSQCAVDGSTRVAFEMFTPGVGRENLCPFLPPLGGGKDLQPEPAQCIGKGCALYDTDADIGSIRRLATYLESGTTERESLSELVGGVDAAVREVSSRIGDHTSQARDSAGELVDVARANGENLLRAMGKIAEEEAGAAQLLEQLTAFFRKQLDEVFRDIATVNRRVIAHLEMQGSDLGSQEDREKSARVFEASWTGARRLRNGFPERAARDYEEALSSAVHAWQEGPLQNGIGAARALAGDGTAAQEHLRRAIQVTPELAAAHCNLGVVLLRQAREKLSVGEAAESRRLLAAARESFEEACRLSPRDPRFRTNLGVVRYQEGHVDLAILQWQEALALDPWYDEARECLQVIRIPPGPEVADPFSALPFLRNHYPAEA